MRTALLISGGGTTAEAIIGAVASGKLAGVEIACVIASTPEAGGIARAKRAGVPEKDVRVVSPKDFSSREEFGGAIIKECRSRGADFVGQYGWLVKTPENVIEAFAGHIVNQHPGPLDPGRLDFGGRGMFGRRVHAARLFFVRAVGRDFWTEATAHRVIAEYDKGAVLHAKRVPLFLSRQKDGELVGSTDDTPETLAARALPVEHEVQIETIAMFAKGEDSPAVNRAVPEGWKTARSTDRVREIARETPLVLPGEEKILEEAKQKAIAMFPNG